LHQHSITAQERIDDTDASPTDIKLYTQGNIIDLIKITHKSATQVYITYNTNITHELATRKSLDINCVKFHASECYIILATLLHVPHISGGHRGVKPRWVSLSVYYEATDDEAWGTLYTYYVILNKDNTLSFKNPIIDPL
jgi:hypothetical protein